MVVVLGAESYESWGVGWPLVGNSPELYDYDHADGNRDSNGLNTLVITHDQSDV